jgi:hypothetical protein
MTSIIFLYRQINCKTELSLKTVHLLWSFTMLTTNFLKLNTLMGVVLMAFGAVAVAATPEISSTTGTMSEGQVITLTGKNFTAKAVAKPLLFWSADGGLNPSPLGRTTAWDGTFNGELVDKTQQGVIIADGSNKSLRHNYDVSEGAILSRVRFNSDQLFVWRKRYDDFDRLKDFAIRTRFSNLKSGKQILVGMYMSTKDKSMWGKVIKVSANADGTGTAFYSNKVGNLIDAARARLVPRDTVLYFYNESDSSLNTPLFEVTLSEGSGIYQTFNHKVFRLWGAYGSYNNNSYISLDRDGMMHSEYTGVGAYWNSSWDHPIDSATRRWVVEEFQYKAGNVDQVDGILYFWQNRVLGWQNQRFRFTTAAYPHKYSDLYQTQVSNGAQPLSYEYFDSLYVDESWHRVLVCAESTWSACKQPEVVVPSAWGDEQIKVSLRLGGLKNKANFYFYVVNGLGEVNEKGYASCPLCPLPPSTK